MRLRSVGHTRRTGSLLPMRLDRTAAQVYRPRIQ
jgi:hypothetical protein